VNTLPVLAVGRARNLGLTPGRGAFVGRELDGVNEHAEAARCHFVSVIVSFVHSTRLVQCGWSNAGSPQRAAPAWLRQCVVGSDDKRRACDDHGLNGERAILAAEVYEQSRE
jgi:hypothetical protein